LLQDGKKIVIVANNNKFKNRFYIYDLEVDNFIHYDLKNLTPVEPFADNKDKRFFSIVCN